MRRQFSRGSCVLKVLGSVRKCKCLNLVSHLCGGRRYARVSMRGVTFRHALFALCAALFYCLISAAFAVNAIATQTDDGGQSAGQTPSPTAPRTQNAGNLNCAYCPMLVTPTDTRIYATVRALCRDSEQNLARMNETQTVTAHAKYIHYLIGCGDTYAGLDQARIYASAVELIQSSIWMLDPGEVSTWRERGTTLISKALPEANADPDLLKLLLHLRAQLL